MFAKDAMAGPGEEHASQGHDTKFCDLLLFVNQQFSICGIKLRSGISTSYCVLMLPPKVCAFVKELSTSEHRRMAGVG